MNFPLFEEWTVSLVVWSFGQFSIRLFFQVKKESHSYSVSLLFIIIDWIHLISVTTNGNLLKCLNTTYCLLQFSILLQDSLDSSSALKILREKLADRGGRGTMKIAFHYLLRLVVIGLVGGGPLKGTRGRAVRGVHTRLARSCRLRANVNDV